MEDQESPIPVIGLGTLRLEGAGAIRTVEEALATGYRHVDTAQRYGNESAVGQALTSSGLDRDELYLTTKLFGESLVPERVRSATEESLSRLDTPYVDALLIHWPNTDVVLEDTLEAMAAVREDGLTRHIGVSNFPPPLFRRAAAAADLALHQAECHCYLQQTELRDLAAERGVRFVAYAPLARGAASSDKTLSDIGHRHGRSSAQVALRWLVQDADVAVIPGTTSRTHLQENLEALDFTLDAGDIELIRDLDRGHRIVNPPFAPEW